MEKEERKGSGLLIVVLTFILIILVKLLLS